MLQEAAAGPRSNTELTQPSSGRAARPPARPRKTGRSPKGPRVTGEERESVRQADRPVIEMEHGITVYPPEAAGEPWRAAFIENGVRRFRQGALRQRSCGASHLLPRTWLTQGLRNLTLCWDVQVFHAAGRRHASGGTGGPCR